MFKKLFKKERVPFKDKEPLRPTEVYGSIIGALENATTENKEKRFEIVDTVEGEIHYQIPEFARVYFDTVVKRHIIVHLPGQTGKRTIQQPEPTLLEIKQKVDEKINKSKIELTNALYFYPVAKYPDGHFIAVWLEKNQIYVEDSFLEATYSFGKKEEKNCITSITDTLNPENNKTVNKTNYRGWQLDNWRCGYYTGDVAKRLILSKEKEKDRPKIDEKYINNVKNDYEKYSQHLSNKSNKSENNSVDEFFVVNDYNNEVNNFIVVDEDNNGPKEEENDQPNPNEILELSDKEFESDKDDYIENKKTKNNNNPEKKVDNNEENKKEVIAFFDKIYKRYCGNINPFLRDRDLRIAQINALMNAIENPDGNTTVAAVIEAWKITPIKTGRNKEKNEDIKAANSALMAKHSNFFRSAERPEQKTALAKFIEDLADKHGEKTLSASKSFK